MRDRLPPAQSISEDVARALAEDIGGGDLTAGLIAIEAESEVRVVCREAAVIAGTAWFDEVFKQLGGAVQIDWRLSDGDRAAPEQTICLLQGNTRALLTGERTALNFLQTLSATATLAAKYALAVEGTGAHILDTRKTIPGLRLAQKYAVLCGGCYNHRIGLFDLMLIKENHIAAAGSIAAVMEMAHRLSTEVEVEVESLAELQQALDADAKRVLLDNFSLDLLRQAVEINAGRARLEASGNVNLETVRAIAETGVDDISVGGLTKDVRAVDLSMRFL